MIWHTYNRTKLLELPLFDYEYDIDLTFSAIILLKTGTKHESSYSHITIIGECDRREQAFILGQRSDAIHLWPQLDKQSLEFVNIDCLWPSGAMRFWTHKRIKLQYQPMSDATFSVVDES